MPGCGTCKVVSDWSGEGIDYTQTEEQLLQKTEATEQDIHKFCAHEAAREKSRAWAKRC